MIRFTALLFLVFVLLLSLAVPALAQFETATPEGDPVAVAEDVIVSEPDDETEPIIIEAPVVVEVEPVTTITLTEDQLAELLNEVRSEGTGFWGWVVAGALAGIVSIAFYAIKVSGNGAPPWAAPFFIELGKTLYAGTSDFVDNRIEDAKKTDTPLDDRAWEAARNYIDSKFAEFLNQVNPPPPPEALG